MDQLIFEQQCRKKVLIQLGSGVQTLTTYLVSGLVLTQLETCLHTVGYLTLQDLHFLDQTGLCQVLFTVSLS